MHLIPIHKQLSIVIRIIISIIIIILLSSSAAMSYPISIQDARGKIITLKKKPMRIVSMAPSNTEILFSLGLGDRVVGVTKYCTYPPEAKKKTKIGDIAMSIEAIVALKPDLVIAHATINDSIIPNLEKLGINVFAVDPKTISSVISSIKSIGIITARPKTVNKLVFKINRQLKSAKNMMAGKPSRKVLIVIQANPLWAAGPKTFVNEMLEILHAKNIAFDARPGFVPFSNELAITRNPDVIIVSTESERKYFLNNSDWKTTNAAKNKRVYLLNNDLIVRPSPRLTEGVIEIGNKLKY